MQQREHQGGAAALTALVQCSLVGAVNADGSSSSSDGNSNGHSDGKVRLLPPREYVWVRRRPALL